MTDKEIINNKKYYTCGRCKHEHTPENERPCVSCIYGTGYGADLWELKQEPCEDCISRQEAILQVQRYGVGCFDAEEFSPEQCERFVIQKLNELPPVTPKEKTEHWIQQPRYDGDDQPDLVCPNCGFKISWWDMGNFCAKCGTGLEGGAG